MPAYYNELELWHGSGPWGFLGDDNWEPWVVDVKGKKVSCTRANNNQVSDFRLHLYWAHSA